MRAACGGKQNILWLRPDLEVPMPMSPVTDSTNYGLETGKRLKAKLVEMIQEGLFEESERSERVDGLVYYY